MAMYDNLTYRELLGRMLESIPDDVDKREGSVIYDALTPAALELARLYSALDNAVDETFADTAGREMLVRRAFERGIIPRSATPAVVKGRFNMAVPIGTRFMSGDLRYKVTEHTQAHEYRLECESAGTYGNVVSGDLVPVEYIDGLTSAEIVELLIPGEDDEETEHLRKRYFDSLETRSYGGNISDYRKIALSFNGVGGVKVFPAFDGGGTVKLVVLASDGKVPSDALISDLQNAIDPADGSGTGEGLAPIGHSVTVEAVNGVEINISAEFTLLSGWQFSDVENELSDIAEEYLREVASQWDGCDSLIVRASQIEARLLNEKHGRVVDIANLRLNDSLSDRNVTLGVNEIPLKGVIVNVS